MIIYKNGSILAYKKNVGQICLLFTFEVILITRRSTRNSTSNSNWTEWNTIQGVIARVGKLYGASSKTQLMERGVQTSETVNYCMVRALSNYVWHPQRSREILECFIVSSVVKDCLVLSQYYLHHGTFL